MRKNSKRYEEPTLRQKAEDSLKNRSFNAGPHLSKADALKLIHELQVYQEELKMQNDELELAKKQVAESAASKYAQLYDFAPSGYFTLNRNGEIIMLNISGANLLGHDRSLLLNTVFGFYITQETRPKFKFFLSKAFKSNKKETCEVEISEKDGVPIYIHLSAIASEDDGECLLSAVDISEQKQTEEMLYQSEKKLQQEVKDRTQELENLNLSILSELIKRKSSQKQLKKSLHDYKLLYAYLQKVREDERLSIARIIHDDLAQLLSTMKIELISWKERPEKQNSKSHDPVGPLLLLVEQCMDAVTSIIVELRPVLPGNMGLIPAIKHLFAEFQKRTGITCDTRIQEDNFSIDNESAYAIYRVIQEALTNIRNHSQASYVAVKISGTPSSFSITMKDNGIGVSQEKINDHRSFGIIGMRERIVGMKGSITFKGVEGKGTSIHLKVPVAKTIEK
jgi:PAS domain S-box-containing protein